jgi:hypothetical protein
VPNYSQKPQKDRRQPPISNSHARLGAELRRARQATNKSTRNIEGYSSGHVSNVENGYVAPSREYVQYHIRVLGGNASVLLPLFQAMNDTSAALRAAGRAKDPHPSASHSTAENLEDLRDEVWGSFLVPNRDAYYVLDESGALQHARYTYTLKARKSDAQIFYVGHHYPVDRRKGVLSIDSTNGCQIYRVDESASGMISAYLRLNHPLDVEDEPASVAYVVRARTKVPALPILGFSTPATEAGRCALHVQFAQPALPEKVWWYLEADYMLVQQDPTLDRLIPLAEDGYYYKEFYQPPRGFYCGIAWHWPSGISS